MGILAGFALRENGGPAPGAVISVTWQEVTERAGGWITVPISLSVSELPDDGFFLLCSVPRDKPVDITVEWNGVLSLPERFRLSRTQRVSQKDVTIRTDR